MNTLDAPVGTVGAYRYDIPLDAWTWTPEVYAMHGLDPAVRPTSALISERRHPDDREPVDRALLAARSTGARFSVAHRVLHADGAGGREIVLVGEGVLDPAGAVTAVRGYYLDISGTVAERVRVAADQAVAAAVAGRAAIEQAKGILSLAFGVDDEVAMSMLRRVSSHSNVKLRTLATRLVEAAQAGAGSTLVLRRRLEEVLDAVSRPQA